MSTIVYYLVIVLQLRAISTYIKTRQQVLTCDKSQSSWSRL